MGSEHHEPLIYQGKHSYQKNGKRELARKLTLFFLLLLGIEISSYSPYYFIPTIRYRTNQSRCPTPGSHLALPFPSPEKNRIILCSTVVVVFGFVFVFGFSFFLNDQLTEQTYRRYFSLPNC